MKEVFIDIERCTACKSCEIACSVQHSKSKDLFTAIFEFPPPIRRIHVEKALSFSYPSKCMHCSDAPCMMACPVGAIYRDMDLGSVHVNKDRCMGCWMCAMVCPFGAIKADPYLKIARKCDFCRKRVKEGRLPACVEACPTGALRFGEVDELSRRKRIERAEVVAKAVSIAGEEGKKVTPLDLLRTKSIT
ncbi:MAG: 4Fe-4S dicluster domain-containing protein [Thermodesulfovibrionales bacterium]